LEFVIYFFFNEVPKSVKLQVEIPQEHPWPKEKLCHF